MDALSSIVDNTSALLTSIIEEGDVWQSIFDCAPVSQARNNTKALFAKTYHAMASECGSYTDTVQSIATTIQRDNVDDSEIERMCELAHANLEKLAKLKAKLCQEFRYDSNLQQVFRELDRDQLQALHSEDGPIQIATDATTVSVSVIPSFAKVTLLGENDREKLRRYYVTLSKDKNNQEPYEHPDQILGFDENMLETPGNGMSLHNILKQQQRITTASNFSGYFVALEAEESRLAREFNQRRRT